MAPELANLGFVGAQYLSHLFECEIVLVLVDDELLANIPAEFLQGSGVGSQLKCALSPLQFSPNLL